MGTRRRDRTILGIGAVELPEELRATLVDLSPREEEEESSHYVSWLGRVVDGKYELQRLIAEGGMGAVFEALPTGGGARVALKVMHAELGANSAIVQRFEREVEIGERLQHEFIVEALDTGRMHDGSAYLVLAYVVGPPLSLAMWEDEQFEWRRAARIGAQIASALEAAWAEGIAHRDLKPDNIVLEPDDAGGETVKLLDFGIAHDKAVTNQKAKLTMMGEVVGTVGYMAPEQTLGQPVDGRCDLYGLGVLLWEMLAGRPLFDEDLELRDFLTTQLTQPPQPIREIAPATPEALAALVHRLLAYQKTERPDDASIVRAELLSVLGESEGSTEEIMDTATDVAAPSAETSPAQGPLPITRAAIERPPEREEPVERADAKKRQVWLLAAAIGAVIFGAGFCIVAIAIVLLVR